MLNSLDDLARLRDGRSKRISSYDRAGGNRDATEFAAGETVTIAKIAGAGCIRHIWITVGHTDPMYKRNMILRMYWDGCKTPSVECPLGDFFGQGWGEEYSYSALPLSAALINGRALNCYFPMPFAKGAVIAIENDSDAPCSVFYHVNYEEYDAAPADLGRFHANWLRSCREPVMGVENEHRQVYDPNNPNLSGEFNHPIIDAEGRGHYVGVNYYVDCPSTVWYGEGDDMFFIDGEKWPPSVHGTGTEDYFNSAWGPKTVFLHPYYGYARVNNETGWLGRTHCYRFHVEDPIIFHKSLRGGIERGHANCLAVDIVTVAYWYQTLPPKPLPPLPDRAGRQNMPVVMPRDIHRWRQAWRALMGGNPWGTEKLPEEFRRKAAKRGGRLVKRQNPPAHQKIAKAELEKHEKSLNRRKKAKGR